MRVLPGIGSHHSSRRLTDEWLTPPAIIDALGPFDLDPCAPVDRPWPTAERHFTVEDDGLEQPWEGRVWLNPPYGPVGAEFMRRMAEHHNGLLLVAARTGTQAFQETAAQADRVVFLRDRLYFIRADGFQGRAAFASCLMAFGHVAVGAVDRADLGWAA